MFYCRRRHLDNTETFLLAHVGRQINGTNPCFCLSPVWAGPVAALAPCGADLVLVNGSWLTTPGWPGRHTCHQSRRCARSCCWRTPMTQTTRCSHSATWTSDDKTEVMSNNATRQQAAIKQSYSNHQTWISCRTEAGST